MQFNEHCSFLFSYNFSIHQSANKVKSNVYKKHALLSINMVIAEHNTAFKIYFIA